MNALFDTHAHLQDPAFAGDLGPVLERAAAAGVRGIALCGYDVPSNHAALELAAQHPMLAPTVGIHPHDAKDVTPAIFAELESLAALPQVVAIGELGLDFYRDHSPHDVQRRVLDDQLSLAASLGKPVCVHSRGAEDEIDDHLSAYARKALALRSANRPVGVMHCFGGSLEQARRYVSLGFLISIACTITYPKNAEARRIAADLPLDALVVETDSPYLPPQRLRGQRNEPAHVLTAAEAVAAARALPLEVVARATTENACRLFALDLKREVAAA
ncbi:MAG: TatD family hydrolase [Dehalococcoidia bacterium]